jgi:hypothetical protein
MLKYGYTHGLFLRVCCINFDNVSDSPFLLSFIFSSQQRAVDAVLRLPESEARDALVRLTHAVITRKK